MFSAYNMGSKEIALAALLAIVITSASVLVFSDFSESRLR